MSSVVKDINEKIKNKGIFPTFILISAICLFYFISCMITLFVHYDASIHTNRFFAECIRWMAIIYAMLFFILMIFALSSITKETKEKNPITIFCLIAGSSAFLWLLCYGVDRNDTLRLELNISQNIDNLHVLCAVLSIIIFVVWFVIIRKNKTD